MTGPARLRLPMPDGTLAPYLVRPLRALLAAEGYSDLDSRRDSVGATRVVCARA